MVLILSHCGDAHSDLVEERLKSADVGVIRLNVADAPAVARLTAEASSDNSPSVLCLNDRHWDLADVSTVWLRRIRPGQGAAAYSSAEAARSGAIAEAVVKVLAGLLRDRFWVNPFWDDRAAHWKPYQLAVAQEVGLLVPRTIITNDPGSVTEFYNQCEHNVVYKTFEPHVRVGPDDAVSAIFASAVTSEMVRSKVGEVALSPSMFQEHINKGAEVRAVVIGRQLFAAEATPRAAVDSRIGMRTAEYRPIDLPTDVANKLLELLKRLALVLGSVDLIRDDQGRYIFLEINPGGQWYWLEQKAGLPLLENVLRMLAQATPDYARASL